MLLPIVRLALLITLCPLIVRSAWEIRSAVDWSQAQAEAMQVELADGLARSTAPDSRFSSVVRRFDEPRQARSITFQQTAAWNDWREIPKVGDPQMEDAPVFIPVAPGEYYLLARYRPAALGPSKRGSEDPRDQSEQGYHAWFSTDMADWERMGPVSGWRERWVTTAEYLDGVFYIYYDHPNDEDPHLIIDPDLKDGKMGHDMGMVYADPSHGSDAAIFRDDADGQFHLIAENWDPLNARTHAWDSPLANHAVSPDGIEDFQFRNHPVDERTTPTGRFGEYIHGTTQDTYRYEIHEPEQNAYGDWTAIKIGEQYYLFCDYDPVGRSIRVGRFTGRSLYEPFALVGELGEGHPDPTIGFAEGRFYLIRQRAETDFSSPGPWVGGVEARVGVDTSGNGRIDHWSPWQEVKESYARHPDYIRVVERQAARLDLGSLPPGYGFAFAYRTAPVTGQQAWVEMAAVTLTFN